MAGSPAYARMRAALYERREATLPGRFAAALRQARRQRVQIALLAEEGVAISPDGSIGDLEMRLTCPGLRDAGRIWLKPDGTS